MKDYKLDSKRAAALIRDCDQRVALAGREGRPTGKCRDGGRGTCSAHGVDEGLEVGQRGTPNRNVCRGSEYATRERAVRGKQPLGPEAVNLGVRAVA